MVILSLLSVKGALQRINKYFYLTWLDLTWECRLCGIHSRELCWGNSCRGLGWACRLGAEVCAMVGLDGGAYMLGAGVWSESWVLQ